MSGPEHNHTVCPTQYYTTQYIPHTHNTIPHTHTILYHTSVSCLNLLLLNSVECECGNQLSEFICILHQILNTTLLSWKCHKIFVAKKMQNNTFVAEFLAIFYKENLYFRNFCECAKFCHPGWLTKAIVQYLAAEQGIRLIRCPNLVSMLQLTSDRSFVSVASPSGVAPPLMCTQIISNAAGHITFWYFIWWTYYISIFQTLDNGQCHITFLYFGISAKDGLITFLYFCISANDGQWTYYILRIITQYI